jgi:phage gp46-like protein
MTTQANQEACIEQSAGRARVFWTTQAEQCGTYVLCGHNCVIPGMQYVDIPAPYPDQGPPPSSRGFRTINTVDWLLSLILNILNTRARTDIKCPNPAAMYGHWSETYREDGLYIGSTMWNAAEKSYVRVNEAVKAITAAVQADMGKLLVTGVADSVQVEGKYHGHNAVDIVIKATKNQSNYVLNLTGSMAAGTWVWH